METRTHIFSENMPDGGPTRLWSYGNHSALSADDVQSIKNLLPTDAKIIQINFESPENYIYPSREKD